MFATLMSCVPLNGSLTRENTFSAVILDRLAGIKSKIYQELDYETIRAEQ